MWYPNARLAKQGYPHTACKKYGVDACPDCWDGLTEGFDMRSVRELLQEILSSDLSSQTDIAKELGVSIATVGRWAEGSKQPRPRAEARLRDLHQRMVEKSPRAEELRLPWSPTGRGVQIALESLLRELREILHRRGRLSARNEALDELSKLLFAHVMSIANGGKGISNSLASSGRSTGAAEAL